MAVGSKIEILKTLYRAPKANSLCDRYLGNVWRECLDHMLLLGEAHLYRVIKEYIEYFNQARPHHGIGQKIPEEAKSERKGEQQGKVITFSVLNGLQHDYRLATESIPDLINNGG